MKMHTETSAKEGVLSFRETQKQSGSSRIPLEKETDYLLPYSKRNNLKMYDDLSGEWWDKDGKLGPLHDLIAPRFSFFDTQVSSWKGKKVLDIGCGGGLMAEFIARRGSQVSGVDISEKSIQEASRHAAQSGLSIDYTQGTAEALPYEDGAFDIVVCVDVLEHVADLPKTISEITRVLKPGGTFLFDTINRTFKAKLIMIWVLEYLEKEIPKGTHDWKMFIKIPELKTLLAQNGLTEPLIRGFDIKGKDKKTKRLKVEVNDNTSVMYIGKAIKQ